MKSLKKFFGCLVLIIFIFGCGTAIKTVITSDPPGARIYWGDAPDNMYYAGLTPLTVWNTIDKPYWKKYYYQIRKVGYENSELIFKPKGAVGVNRFVHATLKPSGESVVYVKGPSFLLSKPSVLGETLGLMKEGTKLTVIDTKGTWYKVQLPGLRSGWIPFEWVVDDASEIEKAEQTIKPLESKTKLEDNKLKSVVLIKPGYVYTEPNFAGTELIFLDKGTKLTVLDTKDNWSQVQSKYFESGWIQTNRVITDTIEIEKTEKQKVTANQREIKPLKSETKPENSETKIEKSETKTEKSETNQKDKNEKCDEIQRLSDKIMSLITTFPQAPNNFHWDWGTKAWHPTPKSFLGNFKKVNGTSLKILRLMDELRKPKPKKQIPEPKKQIPDCKLTVHLTFCRKATVSFSGKGLINQETARIKYEMTGKAPAILLIDFTVITEPLEIVGYGFSIISESPFVSAASIHDVEFNGAITWFKRAKVTQFAYDRGPVVTMGGSKMMIEPYFSVPYTVTVNPPVVGFYTNKGFPGPLAYTVDPQWPPIYLKEKDLQKAFEKGRLILRRKTETKSLSGTVTIDFAPPDPELQAPDPSNPGAIGLWGDHTTHGGFLLATEKKVFIDGHPVVKEGDPVLCPIHGLSKVSRDESSGVFIGDKTVSFEGGKAECGAKILSGDTLTFVEPVKK